ncbi:unnamed protein product, partial [Chrysoparadoxa australica]
MHLTSFRCHRDAIVGAVESVLGEEPLVTGIDYISLGCRDSMEEVDEVGAEGGVLSIAVRLG